MAKEIWKVIAILIFSGCSSKPVPPSEPVKEPTHRAIYRVDGFSDSQKITYKCLRNEEQLKECDGSVNAEECKKYCEEMKARR